MRKAFPFLIGVVAAAAGYFYFARQQTLNALRAENATLQQQLDSPAQSPAADAPAPVSEEKLNDADEKELLQLRSKLMPLREQLQNVSNRVVVLQQSRPSGTSNNQTASWQGARAPVNIPGLEQAKGLAAALAQYLKAHGGKLPDNLASLEGQVPGFPPGFSQQFELMGSNTVPDAMARFSLVAREKQAQPRPPNRWRRIYLRADGQAVILGSAQSNQWDSNESHYTENELRRESGDEFQ